MNPPAKPSRRRRPAAVPQLSLLNAEDPRLCRLMPDKPVLCGGYDDLEATPPLRLSVTRIWAPQRRFLVWVLYRPPNDRTTTIARITSWSYRLGYGGFLLTSLYPLIAPSRAAIDAWRAGLSAQDREGFVFEAANFAGVECRRLRIARVVLATGDLDAQAAEDLVDWMITFREAGLAATEPGKCIGLTPNGWPTAPAISGRTALAEDVVLKLWKRPVARRRRMGLIRRSQASPPTTTLSPPVGR